jgi:hypothetical protein
MSRYRFTQQPHHGATNGNRYAGPCAICGQNVPAGAGLLTWIRNDGWKLTHKPARWVGSPISGQWSDGCPEHETEVTA